MFHLCYYTYVQVTDFFIITITSYSVPNAMYLSNLYKMSYNYTHAVPHAANLSCTTWRENDARHPRNKVVSSCREGNLGPRIVKCRSSNVTHL